MRLSVPSIRISWPTLARATVHLIALLPFGMMAWQIWSNGWPFDPVDTFTDATGKTALQLLIASLTVSPLIRLGLPKFFAAVRRPLGLYAFYYALAHLLVYVWLDYGWNWQFIGQNMLTKRYLIVGIAAFVMMLPLALTSTKQMQRRLGLWWKRIHRLNYLIAVLAVIHYVWLVKSDIREPLVYVACVVLVLLARLVWFTKRPSP